MFETNNLTKKSTIIRINWVYYVLFFLFAVFIIRLFYLQVINYSHYKNAALSDQLKQYQIPAVRGEIYIEDGGNTVPLVLNQTLYTLYADPSFIKNPKQIAEKISTIINMNQDDILSKINIKNSRYAVITNKISQTDSEKIIALKIPGINTTPQSYRIYPQGSLASQTLGFVNNSGLGNYGIEQALNKQLAGTPGRIKAVTDSNGVPLAASRDNIQTSPVNGSNVILSLDLGIQSETEKILQNEYQKTKSKGISAIIMDPNNGQIKAIANYPTYDPSNYQNVSDPSIFQNAAVTNAIEPGSIMKILTTAAALNLGVITPDTSFYDPAHWIVDNFNITDIEEDGGPRQQNIASILSLSLNTGAVWLLMQMGGGQINQKGITNWHDYMIKHYNLGQPTNVEQGYESTGYVPKDDFSNPSIDLTYANTAFGQGVQVTTLQMAAALSSIVNGGTYYQPTLVDKYISPSGAETKVNPVIVNKNVVSQKVSSEMLPLMENVVNRYLNEGFSFMKFSPDYIVGGKTGTAQIANPSGGYYSDKYNGTYYGFVGGDKPQYVIAVFNSQPNVPGYAGAYGGQPVFADLAHMLIDNGHVQPKSN